MAVLLLCLTIKYLFYKRRTHILSFCKRHKQSMSGTLSLFLDLWLIFSQRSGFTDSRWFYCHGTADQISPPSWNLIGQNLEAFESVRGRSSLNKSSSIMDNHNCSGPVSRAPPPWELSNHATRKSGSGSPSHRSRKRLLFVTGEHTCQDTSLFLIFKVLKLYIELFIWVLL